MTTDEQDPLVCPACNAANDAGAVFCSSCGAPLWVMCPNCGANEPAGPFCGQCGGRLDATAPAARPATAATYVQPPQTQPPRAGTSPVIPIVIVVALVIGAGVYFTQKSGGKSSSGSGDPSSVASNSGGGSSSGSAGGQAAVLSATQTAVANQASAAPTPTPQPTPVPPTATPLPLLIDPKRANELETAFLNAAAGLRGPGSETIRTAQNADLIYQFSSYKNAREQQCASMVALLNDAQKGWSGGAWQPMSGRLWGPGVNVPGNLAGVGVMNEGLLVQVDAYVDAATAKALVDRLRTIVSSGELIACQKSRSVATTNEVPPLARPPGGGLAWAFDDTVGTTYGPESEHHESYVWQYDNAIFQTRWSGDKTHLTPDLQNGFFVAIGDASKKAFGR